ncbi:MAG: GH92 family glycosyl hydrolase, partial [Bacteroidales bacterium]|nr:GH92 family glycosyl hydrolase [Bacteroidales bacterium]
KYTDLVDPFIGTGGHVHTYPGASLPFGMVQLSPDSRLSGWDGCSAYHFSDSIIYGFSHTHLSGTGCSDYGDILFMPTCGAALFNSGYDQGDNTGYGSKFRHDSEKASPGYYSVFLEDYSINADFTVTQRTGFHRYLFPETNNANIIIDLQHRDDVIESGIKIISNTKIEGMRRSRAWAKDQHVYFAAEFSQPFSSFGIAVDDEIQSEIYEADGTNIKAFFKFNTNDEQQILVKVGISAVSEEGAWKNLNKENPGWDFDLIKDAAENTWNNELGKINVKGGSTEQQKIFYTALYHSLLAPNLYMDVDNNYRGRDLEIHNADDYDYYTVFSLWDTYRAAHPLFTIIDTKRTNDFIKTFLTQYDEGGMLPVWELGANETGCMIGYHSVPVIVDAYMKGIRNYNVEKAFEAAKNSAMQDHLGLKSYREFGYIPAEKEHESVSKTLEYAYDDWCIAIMAEDLNKKEDYESFIKRAQFYKNIYDPSTGFMRAKRNGFWVSPFDPAEVNIHYTEANSWQYSFYVPQDISGLMKLMGGKEKFSQKLDDLFNASTETSGRDQADISGLIGQYAHGNEPSHHMAYLYSFAGKPWKTQKIVRQIMNDMYTVHEDGLIGNEDCGQMSAWYVLSAMGFYPVTPGINYYVIGSPVFEKVNIKLENGNIFTINANGVSEKNFYIKSAQLNGKDFNRCYLMHSEIMNGGELTFEMTDKPNNNWGSDEDDIPVSSVSDNQIITNPYIESGSASFIDSVKIILADADPEAEIYYFLGKTDSLTEFNIYSDPIFISKSEILSFYATKQGYPNTYVNTAKFSQLDEKRSIKLLTTYAPQYSAGGDMALIDRLRGGDDFKLGNWQGYEGVNLEAIIDLGDKQNIHKISIGFLQDINAWVFMPEWVEFLISDNGEDFIAMRRVSNITPYDEWGTIIKEFKYNLPKPVKAQYVKVVAKNISVCPEWHKGSGNESWIFADEIIVE